MVHKCGIARLCCGGRVALMQRWGLIFDLLALLNGWALAGCSRSSWNVAFEPPNTIQIVTEGIQVGVGKWRILLPRWAAVEVRVSETALLDQSDTIAVNLLVRQQWLGEIFGYTGRFQMHREMKKGRGL